MMSEKTKDRGNKGQTQNRPRMLKNIPGIATWGQIQKDRPHITLGVVLLFNVCYNAAVG